MTVQKLIEYLQKFPPNQEVVCVSPNERDVGYPPAFFLDEIYFDEEGYIYVKRENCHHLTALSILQSCANNLH